MDNNKFIQKQKEYIKKYDLIDFTKYDSYFDIRVRLKGDNVYKSYDISDYTYENNKASCKMKGTEIYDVSIEFDNKDNIKKTYCTCPYCKKGNNCKHLYALLIKSKLESNYDKLINIRNKVYDEYLNVFNSCYNYFKDNIKKYSKEDIVDINFFLSYYQEKRIPRIKTLMTHNFNQYSYLMNIIEIQEEKERIVKSFKEIKAHENQVEYQYNYEEYNQPETMSYNTVKKQKKKRPHSHVGLTLFGALLSGLANGLVEASNNKKTYNKEMDYAMKELELGNPEPYVNLTDYIDDKIIEAQYPIEQEDEDDYN